MADILKGTIKIDAPGVKQTFRDIGESVDGMGKSLKSGGVELTKTLGQLQDQLKRFQAGLKEAGNTESFARIQRAIDATKQRIELLNNINSFQNLNSNVEKTKTNFTGLTRVIQDLPFGFIAISNNLEQLLPAAGSLGLAFSAVVAGLSFAQVGLTNWTRGLSSSKDGIDENTLALGLLSNELESVKRDIDDFTNSLDYANKIGKLRLDIDFGKGLKADLIDLRGQSVGNLQLTSDLEKEADRVSKIASSIRSILIEELAKPGNEKFFEAFDKGILESLDDLPDKIKKPFDRLTAAEKQQADVNDRLLKARQDQNVLFAQIEQKKIDIQEDAAKKAEENAKKDEQRNKEALANLKKYLEERAKIIEEFSKDFALLGQQHLPFFKDDPANKGLARRLQAELQKLIDSTLIQFNVKFKFDEKSAENFSSGFKEVKIPIEPTIKNTANSSLVKDLADFKDAGARIGRAVGAGFDETFSKIFEDAFKTALEKGLNGDALENFKAEFQSFITVSAKGIAGVADAFGAFTDAVLQGKSGIQAFGEALKNTFRQIAVEIVKDIILASILSALSGGAAGGGLSFIQAFGKLLGGSHATGLKRVPKDGYIAELHRDEMVVPARQAGILRQLMGSDFSLQFPQVKVPSFSPTNFSSISNAASLMRDSSKTIDVNIRGELVGRGDHLVSVINKTNRKQSLTV